MASRRRRAIVASIVLAAYIFFGVWAFFLSHNILETELIFVFVSVVLWFILRAYRSKSDALEKNNSEKETKN